MMGTLGAVCHSRRSTPGTRGRSRVEHSMATLASLSFSGTHSASRMT
jgi:hypothetical protein